MLLHRPDAPCSMSEPGQARSAVALDSVGSAGLSQEHPGSDRLRVTRRQGPVPVRTGQVKKDLRDHMLIDVLPHLAGHSDEAPLPRHVRSPFSGIGRGTLHASPNREKSASMRLTEAPKILATPANWVTLHSDHLVDPCRRHAHSLHQTFSGALMVVLR